HGQKGYSPVRLAAGVREELDAVRKIYSGNLSITPVYDQSGVISASLKNLLFSLLIGAAAAFFIILVFMKNLFPALIITASFPSSVFFCLFFLYVTGRSLNIMSLGGLVLGIGMVVDNSIVVSDNIRESLAGSADIKNSIAGAASEMAASTFGSTVTTLIVFLPVLFLPGVMGALFTDLALSVIFSLLGSFLCSVTLVPVLFLMFAGRHIKRKGAGIFNAGNPSRRGLIENIYSRILKGFLRKPLLVLLPVLLVCGAGFFGFERLHFELMPKLSSGELNITVALPPEEPMVLVKQKAADLQHALLSSGAVEMVWARSGGGAGDAYYQADETMRMGVISMTARLRSDQPDNARAGEAVRSLLDVSSLHSEVHKPQDLLDPLFGSLAGLRAAVAGKNPEEALARALDLKVRMEDFAVAAFPENRGAAAVKIFPDSGMSSIYLRPERDILARAGAGFAGVASEIRTALEGTVSFRMERGGRDLDVRVLVNDAQAGSLRRLEDLPLLPEPGSALRLGETGKLILESSPHSLLREGRKDIVLTEAVTVETMRGLQAGWRALVRGTGYAELTSDSVLKEQKTGILLSFCLAFLLIYLFLSAQFESFSEPLLIFLVLPPGAGGLTAALALSRSSINLYSSLGVIVLLGLSVNTSIILFMHYKNISAAGAGRACPAAVVLRGSVRRLKPILMTMLTTILALLPVAVDPARRSAQSGMAAAVIGGLLFSTAFTVFTLPLVYLGVNRLKNRFRKGQT
ncbi:MAG: efflux RND transporter permease subunit, partial [Spirochaetales bacterium]